MTMDNEMVMLMPVEVEDPEGKVESLVAATVEVSIVKVGKEDLKLRFQVYRGEVTYDFFDILLSKLRVINNSFASYDVVPTNRQEI